MSNPELTDGKGPRAWGSDVMVDAMQAHGLRYVTMNPGSSFRGLHDSIVNYGGNSPDMMGVSQNTVRHHINLSDDEPLVLLATQNAMFRHLGYDRTHVFEPAGVREAV